MTTIRVADALDQNLSTIPIVRLRPINRLTLGRRNDACPVGIRLAHGVVALRPALDELLISVHDIPP
jgi:hypothetical protein